MNESRRNATTCLLLIASLAGCGGRSASNNANWFTVSTDAGEIAQAQQAATGAEQERLEGIFHSLAQASFYGFETTNVLEANRPEAVRRLKELIAGGRPTDEAVGATLLLCRLHEQSGRDMARLILQSGDANQRRRILGDLNTGVYSDNEKSRYRDFLFADPELAVLLLQQLDDPDPGVVKAAIQCCGVLDVPGVSERFLKLLHRQDALDRDRLLYWLARGELTPELLDYAVAAAGSITRDHAWGTNVFEEFARQSTGALKTRAQDQLRAILKRWPDEGQLGYDGNRLGILAALAESAEASDLSWLTELAESEKGLYATDPLVAWIRLEPAEGQKVLLRWLAAPDRRRAAINAASKAFEESADRGIAERLAALADGADAGERSAICSALNEIGGATARDTITRVGSQLDPAELARYLQDAQGASSDELLTAIEQSGLLSPDELQTLRTGLAANGPNAESEPDHLFDLLCIARRAAAFDVETGELPCRHDKLVADFADISAGKFTPTALLETWQQSHDDDFDASYLLQFVCNGRLYRGEIRNLGDWYDVERVVAMMNQALSDAGTAKRFLGLDSDGQVAMFVFADPGLFTPLAKRFHLGLSDNLNGARTKGTEFEERVRKSYEQQAQPAEVR